MPSAPPSADAEPLFASDEEALAAAEVAYAEYLAASGTVFGNGGENVEMLVEHATGEVLEEDRQRAEDFIATGRKIEGNTELLDFSLQQAIPGPAGVAGVLAYACLDTFTAKVLDSDGNDIGDPSREPTVTYEVTLESNDAGRLLVSKTEFWSAGPECEL